MKTKAPTIDKSKPYFEIQSFGCTLDMCQSFNAIKKSFASIGIFQTKQPKYSPYKVWKIQAGFRYPVPLIAMQ